STRSPLRLNRSCAVPRCAKCRPTSLEPWSWRSSKRSTMWPTFALPASAVTLPISGASRMKSNNFCTATAKKTNNVRGDQRVMSTPQAILANNIETESPEDRERLEELYALGKKIPAAPDDLIE